MAAFLRGNVRCFVPCAKALVLALLVFATPPANAAEDGIFTDSITFGQSAALSGPAQALGLGMQRGIKLAFAAVNANGGVKGRELLLDSMDDRYEPEQAVENTRRLIYEERVFALIGAVGTPTSKAAEPLATKAGVPYIAPFTGAELLRDPYRATVVNLRASYFQETEALVSLLADRMGKRRIAVFFQDDSFGRAGRTGVLKALERRASTMVGDGRYVRNSVAVKRGLYDIMKTQPDAVIMIGAYEPIATFVQWAAKLEFQPTFATISFVGSEALAEALASRPLAKRGEGVIVSQVVPFPHPEPGAPTLPLVRDFLRDNAAYGGGGSADLVTFEGYVAGRLTAELLGRIEGELTRVAFTAAVQAAKDLSLGGFPLSFDHDDSQGSDQVYLTELDGKGSLRPLRLERTR